MFARFSFSLSRVFRFRSRRGTKANADSVRLTQRFSPEPFSSKSRRPDPPRLEPINTNPSTTRPRTTLFRSLLSPISQSPITTSTPISDTLSPVLIIGRDPAQSTLSTSTTTTPPSDVRPQTHVEASLLEPVPVPHLNARRISFQLPTTLTEELPESPLSRSSTLISGVEAEMGPEVSAEQRLPPEASDSSSVRTASAEPIVGLDDGARSSSGKTRPVSLSIPQRVRMNVSRFSLPVMPAATASTDARNGRRESKRMSLTSLMSGSGTAKKEKRPSWLSRELSKPETQEVLRALAYVM
ncbi:hypothetical protein J3R82DRAFT_2922 [Butyriboletus roseoflavus]|nr:hypothetical protein J3R82DRAFT_2922 [Butyriboletus roseoflavus]